MNDLRVQDVLDNLVKGLAENTPAGGGVPTVRLEKGVRKSKWHCPIANWLRRELELSFPGEGVEVEVLTEVVFCRVGYGHYGSACLPDVVKRFVNDFDRGLYPELEEEGP